MTVPYERYRAVLGTKEFLQDLLDTKKTPRIPKNIRQQALWCLRHYPSQYEMDIASEKCPEFFKKEF